MRIHLREIGRAKWHRDAKLRQAVRQLGSGVLWQLLEPNNRLWPFGLQPPLQTWALGRKSSQFIEVAFA